MDERCYFGCDEPIYHALLELAQESAPQLCRFHSDSWSEYKRRLDTRFHWPDSFWPWVERTRKEMIEKVLMDPSKTETRPPGTEILASEAITGFWYTVPSGEIERCYGQRSRGRGVQVGFVGILDSGADTEDIRWLQGRTSILVVDECEAARLFRAGVEHGEGYAPDLAFGLCPRNGLVCLICELPQRETPSGAACETPEHGGAEGKDPIEVANRLGEEGHPEEARAVLDSVPFSATIYSGEVREPPPEVAEKMAAYKFVAVPSELTTNLAQAASLGEAIASAGLEQLAARTADQLVPPKVALAESDPGLAAEAGALLMSGHINAAEKVLAKARHSAGPTSIFHKSLHIDWRTPKALFDAQVARWGPYWLDAAATAENKLCEYHLGPGSDAEDALSVDWAPTEEIVQQYGANIWLNHPYSKGENPCTPDCAKPKCAERGYHLDRRVASSAEWMLYARNQALGEALQLGGVITCLTKRAGETQWWKDSVLQHSGVGAFVSGRCDPGGGPAAEFMNTTPYKAAMWIELRWERLIVDIVEIEGRVDFDRGGEDGSAGFPSAIVTYYKPGSR